MASVPDTKSRQRKVGVYDRPKLADVQWIRWLVILLLLALAVSTVVMLRRS